MASADTLAVISANLEEIRCAENQLHILTEGQIAELTSLFSSATLPADNCKDLFGNNCSLDFARFCRRALHGRTAPELLSSLLGEFAPVSTDHSGTITAYVRNLYADRAFARFSKGIQQLAARYFPSFTTVCEEVYYDRCPYCILPLQTSEDGMLSSFSRLIEKYELKIWYVCDIPTNDNESTVRYALLRRGIVPNCPVNGYFDASFILSQQLSIGRFFAACEETGASITRITSMPVSYTDDIISPRVTFRVSTETTAPLLYFLRSVLHSYTPEGLYSNI